MNGFLSEREGANIKAMAALLFSVAVAVVLLYVYKERTIRADDFALGKENCSR